MPATAISHVRPRNREGSRRCGEIIPCSDLRQTSNNIIQKGLAFVRKRSGSVTVPGARRALGILPRRSHGRGGAVVVAAAMTPHQRNGGSRCQDSPIPNSSFCPRLRGAMIAELTCRQTLRPKRFERPWIGSSELAACAHCGIRQTRQQQRQWRRWLIAKIWVAGVARHLPGVEGYGPLSAQPRP